MNQISGDVAEITFTWDGLGEGEALPTSALIRPYRVLLKEGKKVGRLTFNYYRGETSPAKVFGTFCVSSGKRLMFFPGLVGRKILWHTKTTDNILPRGFIDHITIEPDFKTWHLTTLVEDKKEGKPWIKGSKLHEIEPDLFLWFGLSLRSEDMLEICPKIVKLNSTESPVEAKEFGEIVLESRKGSIFNILELPDQEGRKEDTPNFLHFDVLIDKRRDSEKEDFKFKTIAPNTRPMLKTDMPLEQQVPIRGHYVRIPNFDGIIRVGVSLHQGILSEDSIISNFET